MRRVVVAPRNAAEAVAVGVSLVLFSGAAVAVAGDAGVSLLPSTTRITANDAPRTIGTQTPSPLENSANSRRPESSRFLTNSPRALLWELRILTTEPAADGGPPDAVRTGFPTPSLLPTITSMTSGATPTPTPTTTPPPSTPVTTPPAPTTGPPTSTPTTPPTESPTDPPVEPTDPPVEPTDPPVEPTDPPTEPPTDPPPVEPTEPVGVSGDPTATPSAPPGAGDEPPADAGTPEPVESAPGGTNPE